ncbi:hypothetical protein D3C84_915580 [compost metagenome]
MSGITADVPIHTIRAGDQQPGHAFVHRGDYLHALQARRTGLAIDISCHITVPARDQRLGHLRVVIKKLEQSLDHALRMGRTFIVLPEKLGNSQGRLVSP